VTFLRTVWLIVRKDLTIEFRSREIAYTTLFFAVAVVLVFAFALVKEGVPPQGASAAVLWIAILFAGNLALGRTFERERQAETLRPCCWRRFRGPRSTRASWSRSSFCSAPPSHCWCRSSRSSFRSRCCAIRSG
jgi:hypothetical protein